MSLSSSHEISSETRCAIFSSAKANWLTCFYLRLESTVGGTFRSVWMIGLLNFGSLFVVILYYYFQAEDHYYESKKTYMKTLKLFSYPTFQMFQPLLLGLAQVYGSEKLEVGALILLAMLVASPIIFFHCLMGELVSIFTGW